MSPTQQVTVLTFNGVQLLAVGIGSGILSEKCVFLCENMTSCQAEGFQTKVNWKRPRPNDPVYFCKHVNVHTIHDPHIR